MNSLNFLRKGLEQEIVGRTRFVLEKRLSSVFGKKAHLGNLLVTLWFQTKKVFEKGGELKIKGRKLGVSFFKNELVCHNEYHVAKVVQLATEMVGNYLKQKGREITEKDKENAFCLIGGAIIHDLGYLRQDKETKPQQFFIKVHEERAILLVDKLTPLFKLPSEKEAIIARKLKLLIAATKISAEKPRDKKLPSYIKMIRAADLGSYIFNPTLLKEPMSLWRENQRIYLRDKKLENIFTPGIAVEFSGRSIFDQLWGVYGEFFKLWLDKNSKWYQYLKQMKNMKAMVKEIIKEKNGVDLLRHLEGGISPGDLLTIAKDFGIEKKTSVKKALMRQSAALARLQLGKNQRRTDWLSTVTIKVILKAVKSSQRKAVMKAIFEKIIRVAQKEGLKRIGLAINFLDFKEFIDGEEIIDAFEKAKKRLQVDLIYGFDGRRLGRVDFKTTLSFIKKEFKLGNIKGVNIKTQKNFSKIDNFVQNLREMAIPFSVHLGENGGRKLKENFKQYIKYINWIKNQNGLLPALVIDGHLKEILGFVKNCDNKMIIYTELLKFLLTSRKPGQNKIWQFWELQKRGKISKIGVISNNSIAKGEDGWLIEELIRRGINGNKDH